ncbi:hypothetical protein D9M73_208320 [compost metagenome]
MVNQVGEDHAQHHGRQERDQQVCGKPPGARLGWQTDDHVEDLASKLPHHRQDGTQLNDDVERHRPLAPEAEQVGHDDLVAGAGNGQELGQPFYNPKYQCLKGGPKIHQSPKRLCAPACPVNIFPKLELRSA